MPEMNKDAAKVLVVLFHSMIQLADVRLVQKPQDLFLELPAALARDDLHEIDLFVDRFLHDSVEFGVDLAAPVVDVM